jgi:hypothetical protein
MAWKVSEQAGAIEGEDEGQMSNSIDYCSLLRVKLIGSRNGRATESQVGTSDTTVQQKRRNVETS